MKNNNKAKVAFTFEKRVFGKGLALLLCMIFALTPYLHAQATSSDSFGTTVFDKIMLKKIGYTCLGYLKKLDQEAYKKYRLPAFGLTVHYSLCLPEVYINDSHLFFYSPLQLKAFKKIVSYTYKIDPLIPRTGQYPLIKQLKFKVK